MEFQKKNYFSSPPEEGIIHRLEELRGTLNNNTTASAKALKELLETVELEPVSVMPS